jgi:4-alpha-glucanotransferase
MNDVNAPAVLDALAEAAGIEPAYFDIWGNRHVISEPAKAALLQALGVPCATPAAIDASLTRIANADWQKPLPPVVVSELGQPVVVPLVLPLDGSGTVQATLCSEDGTEEIFTFDLAAAALPERRHLDGRDYVRYQLELPTDVPAGYHRFSVDLGRPLDCRLIVAPTRCYLPPVLDGDGRVWGLSVQLYALRRAGDWGIGDFTALIELIDVAARLGASLIGLNPLHALFLDAPDKASPYSPSSRCFLNPLYIDVEAVPDFAASKAAADAFASLSDRIAARRASRYVDYTAVAEIKLRVLEAVFDTFCSSRKAGAKARRDAFAAYCEDEGEPLRLFAVFSALSERFAGQVWREWPAPFQHPDSPEVAAFARENAARIDFFRYLQWITEAQLSVAQQRAMERGLSLGLYRDLAVGSALEGADAWAGGEVICTAAKVGCPPDPFNLLGQDWQVPPFNPLRLREARYEPFIQMLRANMRHAGALRIDHVMGLLHLYLMPAAADARSGAYVAYPFEDLLAIVCLESHRNRCVVVGEDLGTVPEGFRDRMAAANILSYRLFFFEKANEQFKAPKDYPALALACVTTHDLATLAGFWAYADIELKAQLGLYPDAAGAEAERQARIHDKWLMLIALQQQGLLPPGRDPAHVDAKPMDSELIAAVHGYLALSPAKILLVQLDDLMEETEQTNVPGTIDERPNWRRKLSKPVACVANLPAMRALAPLLAGRIAARPVAAGEGAGPPPAAA